MDLGSLSSNWKKLQASGTVTGKKDSGTTATGVKRKRDAPIESIRARTGQQPTSVFSKSQHQKKREQARTSTMPSIQVKSGQNGVRGNYNNQTIQTSLSNDNDDNIPNPESKPNPPHNPNNRVNEGLSQTTEIGKYIAIDCEMVGVGPKPDQESALARVSLVDYNGDQIYDSYVRPREEVTDWRTHVSGIRPVHMVHARTLEEVQGHVAGLIRGRVVVGHSVRGDFEALFLDHPRRDVRDTARHGPYRKAVGGGGSPKLKVLAAELLGLEIQVGEHSSVEDARATMLLFRRDKDAFEREHVKRWGPPVVVVKSKKVVMVEAGGVGHGDGDGDGSEKVKKKKNKNKNKKKKR